MLEAWNITYPTRLVSDLNSFEVLLLEQKSSEPFHTWLQSLLRSHTMDVESALAYGAGAGELHWVLPIVFSP